MKLFKKLSGILQYSVLVFNLIVGTTSIAQHNPTNYCEDIRNQTLSPSLLNSMTVCRSHKLYFRTSLGLFQVTSVDYNKKTLTISHSSSSSLQFVSPMDVTAGFPSPPDQSNSLLLFNCSSSSTSRSRRGICSSSRIHQEQEKRPYYECLVVNDVQNMDKRFHPKRLNCSNYMWVHRNYGGYKMGTRICLDIPDHVPDLCKECEKPNGNCGAGLRCLCHAKECKDKVLSKGGSIISSIGNVLFPLLSFVGVVAIFMEI
ncbi:stress-response A/B barrel domain-containing protein isoform X1 [Senna tora]|uniref:Stress-response A/B barrel domain-containing protein isoform X1 n=1 Tax=Senna tora TaxID=362788 RepID=A0A834W693_9FABA|nr:stress-response A/B barrel domain-containing protein isoform X1 [Senna tora]